MLKADEQEPLPSEPPPRDTLDPRGVRAVVAVVPDNRFGVVLNLCVLTPSEHGFCSNPNCSLVLKFF